MHARGGSISELGRNAVLVSSSPNEPTRDGGGTTEENLANALQTFKQRVDQQHRKKLEELENHNLLNYFKNRESELGKGLHNNS